MWKLRDEAPRRGALAVDMYAGKAYITRTHDAICGSGMVGVVDELVLMPWHGMAASLACTGMGWTASMATMSSDAVCQRVVRAGDSVAT